MIAAKLRNGAREIARLSNQRSRRQWVMANNGGAHPFVTWEVDEAGNAYHGHYFATHNDAAADLIARADFTTG